MHSIKDTVKQLIGKSLDAYNKKYTSPINNRIDNIVAQAGTDNTEIVDARIDSAGVSHTTLNNRILAETKMTDEKLIEYSGSSLSVEDTMPGYLQNIEIKGNTIQNEDNLEDIRSVGNKIEGQELYEIPVLSTNKNIFSSTLEVGDISDTNGIYQTYDASVVRSKEFIKVKPNTTYCFSVVLSDTASFDTLYEYGRDKKFIKKVVKNDGMFTTSENAGYISFKIQNRLNIDAKVQIEEGTVATPYEPYVEDKITILSPTPLEKVGDVADRVICKDGVWGVEKGVVDFSKIPKNWSTRPNDSGLLTFECYISEPYGDVSGNKLQIICSKLVGKDYNTLYNNPSMEGIGIKYYNNNLVVRVNISPTKLISQDINGITKYLDDAILKTIYNTPQFIPLPHDQQVKLRTFANKTNISFLTEIEGTIKAQVPKSLGATVNTHTEQISNLNKELDRVKKLEESTVSTVETESNFTTVEATSNGYFEDVKLEGKTLVNLADPITSSKWISGGSSRPTLEKNNNSLKVTMREVGSCILTNNELCEKLQIGKTYTIMFSSKVTNISDELYFGLRKTSTSTYVKVATINNNGVYCVSFTVPETFDRFLFGTVSPISTLGSFEISNVMLLEGDHTQNPPNGYIEGLKSVGDGTDEIVVSSVNENLLEFDSAFTSGVGSWDYANLSDDVSHSVSLNSNSCEITITNNSQYHFLAFKTIIRKGVSYSYKFDSTSILGNNVSLFKDLSVTRGQKVGGDFSGTFVANDDYNYIAIPMNREVNTYSVSNFILTKYTQVTEYTPHQSDKKRLLFYNEETQTWEKPILREWDSIEKHSNGKYYYHQRSGEVVLNGSEDWVINAGWSGEELNTNSYYLTGDKQQVAGLMVKSIGTTNIISEVMPTQRIIGSNPTSNDFDLVSGEANTSAIYIRINKSKVSNGIKPYLQQNPMRVVYQLAQEKVYECTNIDLITYTNETNYIVESGTIAPKSILKVHNNISNVVSLLQKKVSLLESNMTKYMITQNRMQLASTYSADSVTFKVDYFSLCGNEENYDEDLYNLILNNILVGKDNYNYDKMFTIILDYASWNQISWEQFDILVGLMDMQHNPPVEDEIVEEIPNEVM